MGQSTNRNPGMAQELVSHKSWDIGVKSILGQSNRNLGMDGWALWMDKSTLYQYLFKKL